jgi:heme exporter protein D
MICFAFLALGPQEVTILLLGGAVVAFFAGYVARQAKRRGYSFWLWLLANLVTLNPLLVLIVLAVLPDARKMALRRELRAELEARLAARPRPEAALPGPAVPACSIGDQATVVPPQLRSIGDEETRA